MTELTRQQKEQLIKEFHKFGGFGVGHRQGLSPKTLTYVQKAKEFISEYDFPLTVRQVYYRFVGEQLIENSLKSYKKIASILAKAREEGLIPFSRITDRTRQAIKPSSWNGIEDFLETVKTAYRRNLNEQQSNRIEVWVEKDALAGVFEPITERYDVYLCVGRGYPSHSALYEASKRLSGNEKENHILYFGDFDPSGEDIYRDVQNRMLELFGIRANFRKVSLTFEDIQQYNLPPAPAKKSDTRSSSFISKHGDVSVELDAMPPKVLQEKVTASIEQLLDLSLFNQSRSNEASDLEKLEGLIQEIQT
jgi:hypothetical protein